MLKGAARFALRKDTLKPARRKTARAAASAAALADGGEGDPALFEALKRRRLELAKEQRRAGLCGVRGQEPDRHGAAQADARPPR